MQHLPVRPLQGQPRSVSHLRHSPNGDYLAAGSPCGTVKVRYCPCCTPDLFDTLKKRPADMLVLLPTLRMPCLLSTERIGSPLLVHTINPSPHPKATPDLLLGSPLVFPQPMIAFRPGPTYQEDARQRTMVFLLVAWLPGRWLLYRRAQHKQHA